RLAGAGASAGRHRQRKNAEDEAERRHQHRAESLLGTGSCGLGYRKALFAAILGKLDDQDRVFRGKPYQKHDGDLRIKAVLQVEKRKGCRGTEKSGTERQDDREWQHPAFVLCDEEKIGEQERQREDHRLLTLAAPLLEGETRPLEPVPGG